MTTITANFLFKRFSIYYLLITGVGLFLIIAAGARGPLICFLSFIIIKMLFIITSGQRKKILSIFLFSILLIMASGKEQTFLLVIEDMLISQQMSNRLVQKISDRAVFEDSVRVELRKHSLDIISAHPLVGIGIINDRVMLAGKMGSSPEEARGWYPHNIAIEFLVQYGIIPAMFLLLGIGILFIRAVKVTTDNDFQTIVLIFFSVRVIPLLFLDLIWNRPSSSPFSGFV
ncbi:MAG: O-antigen ligase family protein [Holophagaceae bacterium]|nr:O-antigen ligase family protein [Holophagaceae bacterium]